MNSALGNQAATLIAGLLLSLLTFGGSIALGQAPDNPAASIEQLRSQAVQAAVRRVKPVVVRLDLFSDDPQAPRVGTGMIISPNGYLVTSSFFLSRPDTQVVVQWRDQKVAARHVATDHSRQISLLKMGDVDSLDSLGDEPRDCQVGETVIAIGHTFSATDPNASVGIVSAKNRLWGKVLQTDAKTSPANYGGPLVNLRGEVVGLLTAISATDTQQGTSQEWYDSGIGFAVPLGDVRASVARMKKEGDLRPGLTGIRFQTRNSFRGRLRVAGCYPRSPAQQAGIQPDDLVLKVNGSALSNLRDFKQVLGPRYAGDTVEVDLQRGQQALSAQLQLVDELSPYRFPYLGILPDHSFRLAGVKVAAVDRNGPAAEILQPGDILTTLDDEPLDSVAALRQALADWEAGNRVTVTRKRGEDSAKVEVELGALVQPVMPDSWVAFPENAPVEVDNRAMRLGGYAQRCELLIPRVIEETNRADLLVILANSSEEDTAILERFRFLAESSRTVVMMIFPEAIDGWQSSETAVVELAIRKVRTEYPAIDNLVIHSRSAATSLASELVQRMQGGIRGWIMATPRDFGEIVLPFSHPGRPLFVLVQPDQGTLPNAFQLGRQLREQGIPVETWPAKIQENKQGIHDSLRNWLRFIDRM